MRGRRVQGKGKRRSPGRREDRRERSANGLWTRRWLDAYARAWRALDAEAAAQLFSEDCVFRSHPFRELEDARAYTTRVMGEERDVHVRFGEPVVAGPRGAVEYWATMLENDKPVTLAGLFVFRVGPDGQCAELRDYWAMEPGHRSPPTGWGT